jgi:hypothetical protein
MTIEAIDDALVPRVWPDPSLNVVEVTVRFQPAFRAHQPEVRGGRRRPTIRAVERVRERLQWRCS